MPKDVNISGNGKPDTGYFKWPMWNPLSLARWIKTYDLPFYGAHKLNFDWN